MTYKEIKKGRGRPFKIIKERHVNGKMVCPIGFEFFKFDNKNKKLLFKKKEK